MKIRQGFVSNSSSSSFVVSCPVTIAKKALKLVDPKIRDHMKDWFLRDENIVNNKGVKWYSSGGLFESDETYGVMCDAPVSGGKDEQLAFDEIGKFFAALGPLSHFDGY